MQKHQLGDTRSNSKNAQLSSDTRIQYLVPITQSIRHLGAQRYYFASVLGDVSWSNTVAGEIRNQFSILLRPNTLLAAGEILDL